MEVPRADETGYGVIMFKHVCQVIGRKRLGGSHRPVGFEIVDPAHINGIHRTPTICNIKQVNGNVIENRLNDCRLYLLARLTVAFPV